MWAGVDVGGRRKGFHVAVVDAAHVVDHARCADPAAAVGWLAAFRPTLVAVDSPRVLAPDGARSRADERALVRAVCGIRYTPDAATLAAARARGSRFYEWIEHGLELYAALTAAGIAAVECFPTATWTRLAGPRAGERRSAWSARALAAAGLAGVPARPSQDVRDAIGAALTARLHADGATESFGAIVVPHADALAPSSARD